MSTSDIIAVCAILISVMSLISTILQFQSSKKHNILSVRPSLNINWELTDDNKISCSLSNGGIGPAYLSRLNFKIPNKKVQIKSYRDFISFFNDNVNSNFDLDHGTKFGVRYGGFDKQAVIPSGRSLLMMEFYNDNKLDHSSVLMYIKDLEIEVYYKCAYEKDYSYNSTSIRALIELL